MVADVWVEVSHDTDRVVYVVLTDFFVYCDAVDTLVLLGFQLGLDLDLEGKYPPISPEMSERLVETMIRTARGVSDFGSAFPYARKTDEDDHAYLARLETLA